MTNKLNERTAKIREEGKQALAEGRRIIEAVRDGSYTPKTHADFPDQVEGSFIFSYDGEHRDYFQELIEKSNERFRGTKAKIPAGTSGEVKNMYVLKRLALITAIANDSQLRSGNVWPITPFKSELLFRDGKLPKPDKYWEDLGLIFYDTSSNGNNLMEAKALYDSLGNQKLEFGLSQSDLTSRLLVVNAGLDTDSSMPHGVKPIAIPGVTQIYSPDILNQMGSNHTFEYGLDRGLPAVSEIGNGDRTLYMPSGDGIGLRVLIRRRNSYLSAGNRGLVNSDAYGRVNFAPQGASP